MRKYLLSAFSLCALISAINAKPVSVSVAQIVASSFYAQKLHTAVSGVTLTYTETSATVGAVYYVFNVNNSGFVIISADDAINPVIGYSNEGSYVVPQPGSNFYYWMQNCATHLAYLKLQKKLATPQVADEWNSYQNNNAPHYKRANNIQAVSPLCQTTWNQPSPYNNMCPGGSVTGCVATAMAQVMKYWNYPSHGIGSSFYYETSPENYGLLFANYDTSNYVWSAMPNNVSSNNNEVAKLMYDCGVSVDMGYSPSESGAWVIVADDKICAQSSYVNYFGYNAKTIQGIKRKGYTDSAWIATIENELNSGRVVEYAGWDSVNGGHTWVCDGYDVNNKLHMNWGWSGYDNGYYVLDTLNPNPYFFSKNEELVIGIEPPPLRASFDATPINGCVGLTVNFTDRSLVSNLSAPITSWKWTFTGGTPASSNIANPTVVYNTAGVYPVTLVVTNINGVDTLTKTSYININGPNALPFTQNFEGAFPPLQWAISNPWAHPASWSQYSGTGGYGNSSHCMYFNNCLNGKVGNYDQVHSPAYDFSSVTNPYIYFDVAYTPYNEIYSDTLAVYYSLDCGNTFTRVYLRGGMNLCTTGGITVIKGANADMNDCFVPLSSNWRTDTIMIPAIAGQSNVMFSFENRSGNGSNIFIDNINTSIPTGVNNLSTLTSISVYPNPNTGVFQLKISNYEPGSKNLVEIHNILGQEVYTKELKSESTQINLSGFSKGIYSVVLKYGEKQAIQKVAIF